MTSYLIRRASACDSVYTANELFFRINASGTLQISTKDNFKRLLGEYIKGDWISVEPFTIPE